MGGSSPREACSSCGILADEHQRVTDTLEAVGFESVTRRVMDGWASLLLGLSARP